MPEIIAVGCGEARTASIKGTEGLFRGVLVNNPSVPFIPTEYQVPLYFVLSLNSLSTMKAICYGYINYPPT